MQEKILKELSKINSKLDILESNQAVIIKTQTRYSENLKKPGSKLDKMENRLDNIEKHIVLTNERISNFEKKLNQFVMV
jgi:hypothetical protein